MIIVVYPLLLIVILVCLKTLIIWGFVRSDTVLSLQQSHLWTLYIEGSQKSVHHLDKNPGLLCTVIHELQSTSYTLTHHLL